MFEALLYTVSSLWFGALHAATPGHGKTVAAAYLVGARGRVVDAITLGVIVTVSHTAGIIVFGLAAVLSSAALLPRLLEQYVAVGTGLLILAVGLAMLSQCPGVRPWGERPHPHAHTTAPEPAGWHRHGFWGRPHAHPADLTVIAATPPSLRLLTALGIAGGVMPDPGALAVLLSAINGGRLVLGLLSVLVFSLGFAATLVAVGLLAGRAGALVFQRLRLGRWLEWLRVGSAVVVVGYGLALVLGALRSSASLT